MKKLIFLIPVFLIMFTQVQAQYITTATIDSGATTSGKVTLPDGYYAASIFVPQGLATQIKFSVSDVGTTFYRMVGDSVYNKWDYTLYVDSSKALSYPLGELLESYKFLKVIINVAPSSSKTVTIMAMER